MYKLGLGAIVYPFNFNDFENLLLSKIEGKNISLNNLYGVITEINKFHKYKVTWCDDRTNQELITYLKVAWFSNNELTTDQNKFLDGYNDFENRYSRIKATFGDTQMDLSLEDFQKKLVSKNGGKIINYSDFSRLSLEVFEDEANKKIILDVNDSDDHSLDF